MINHRENAQNLLFSPSPSIQRGTMSSIVVELNCPKHGLERFQIKVIKKYNVKSDLIVPKFRSRPKTGLSSLVVGRNVSSKEIEVYLNEYFRQKQMAINILKRTV